MFRGEKKGMIKVQTQSRATSSSSALPTGYYGCTNELWLMGACRVKRILDVLLEPFFKIGVPLVQQPHATNERFIAVLGLTLRTN